MIQVMGVTPEWQATTEKDNGINPNGHTDHVTHHARCSDSRPTEVSGARACFRVWKRKRFMLTR